MLFLFDTCTNYNILRIVAVILRFFNVICFVAPVILIVRLSIDFAKNVMAGEIDDHKTLSIFIKRIISCMAIFLVPIIVSFAMGLTGLSSSTRYQECIDNSEEADSFKDNTENQGSSNKGSSSSNGSSSNKVGSSSNGGSSNSAQVVSKIILNKKYAAIGSKKNVVSMGKTYANNTVGLTAKGDSNKVLSSKDVTWKVTKGKGIVKVDTNGKVTAITGGKATVRATSKANSNVYVECQVTVVHS